MSGKKSVIRISALIFFVSLLAFSIVIFADGTSCYPRATKWIETVAAGMMTSSIVTLLISIGEYKVEKRKAVEAFFGIERRLSDRYRELNYIEDKADDKDVAYAAIEQYRSLCGIDLSGLGDAYAAIDYLFINKKVRPILYQQIVKKLDELNRLLAGFRLHLKVYDEAVRKTGSGDAFILLEQIDLMQGKLFKAERTDHQITVYKELCYNMDVVMHHELKRLYGRSYNELEPNRKDYMACGRMIPLCDESKEVVCDAAGKEELS